MKCTCIKNQHISPRVKGQGWNKIWHLCTFLYFSEFCIIFWKNIKMFAYVTLLTVAYLSEYKAPLSKNDLRLTFDLTFYLLCCHLGTTVDGASVIITYQQSESRVVELIYLLIKISKTLITEIVEAKINHT